MDSGLESYLRELEGLLRGRVPQEELQSIIAETASHLHDLTAEMGGDVAGALAKFGPSKRFARRLLLSRDVAPPLWRAALWPLGAALIYHVATIFGAEVWLWRLPEVFGYYGPYLFACLAWIVVFAGFFRARQILWKPLLAIGAIFFVVAALSGPLFHFVVRPETGQAVIINRGIAGQQISQLRQDVADLDRAAAQLRLGQAAFRGSSPGQVPAELRSDGLYKTPDMIAGPWRWEGAEQAMRGIPRPFFVWTVDLPSSDAVDWTSAVAAWRNSGPVLAQVEGYLAKRRAVVAAFPAGQRAGYRSNMAGLAGPWLLLVVENVVVLLEMNLIAWVLWHLWRRVAWPLRRRLA